MKTIYLLDTNIVSHVTKPEPDENLITNLELHSGTCAISSITWYELLNGMELLPEGHKKDKLRIFLNEYVQPSFPIIPYESYAAKINADITSVLIPKGKPAPILDTQIASIAVSNNMNLVTRNTKHFESIQKVSPLMLENWFE